MELFGTIDSQFMESFFHHSSDAISIIGNDSLICYVNPAFEALYGLSKDDIIGLDVWQLWPENPADFPYMANQVLTNQLVSEYETKRQRPDGTFVYVSLTISPIRNTDGDTIAYLTVGRDITDRKLNEQLLLQAEKLSVVAQLGAAIAHEIRNPLTSVKGFVKFMAEAPDKQTEYAEIIDTELRRIEGIIDTFLMTASSDAAEVKTCDVRDVVRKSLARIESYAARTDALMVTDLGDDSCRVHGDGIKLKQVFFNLLKNAIESMPQGGNIHVTLQACGDLCVVKIADEGCGIPPHLLGQLGTPFYTTTQKGTGLGLTVCQNILQQHQGKMIFSSNPAGGTTVSVELPLALSASPNVG